MFCTRCGKQIDDSAKFCNFCGAAIEGSAPVQEEAVKQPEFSQVPVEPVSQPEVAPAPVEEQAIPVSQPEAAQPVYQAPVQQTPVESKGKEKKAAKVKTGKKFDKKKLLIIGAVVVALIIIIAIASGGGEEPDGPSGPGFKENLEGTSDFVDALNAGDMYTVGLLYDDAFYNDSDKVEKYHEIVLAKIDEIINALATYDFDTTAATSENAVEDFLIAEYGDLIVNDGEMSLYSCLPYDDGGKQNALDQAIYDAQDYCDGVKHFVTREDNYDVANAIESMATIKETSPLYDKAQAKMVKYSKAYLDETMKTVDSYIASGDFASAVELISGLRSDFENMGLDTATVDKVLNAIVTDYAETYVKKAEEAFKNKDARAAIGNMDAALQLCPDNAEYKAKRDEYALYLPFELYKEENMLVKNGTQYRVFLKDSVTANDNTMQTNCLEWSVGTSDQAWANITYNLAGNYDYVSGKIFLPEDEKSYYGKAYLKIYGDGALLYESPVVSAGMLPQDVWFSVTGVQNLVIEFWGTKDDSYNGVHGAISNLTAQKNFPEAAQ